VTLLELVAVLFVLGMGAALVLPSFVLPAAPEATVDRLVEGARERAIARAQALTLAVGRDGRWTLATGTPDEAPVDTGHLAVAPAADVRVLVSPLGACVLVAPVAARLGDWDAARCRPRGTTGPGA
jgi:type II secretory pathway pseudopilin PulG